jgi:hypothetical protein
MVSLLLCCLGLRLSLSTGCMLGRFMGSTSSATRYKGGRWLRSRCLTLCSYDYKLRLDWPLRFEHGFKRLSRLAIS